MHAVLVLNHFVEYYQKKCCKTARKHVAYVRVRKSKVSEVQSQKLLIVSGLLGINGHHVLRLVEEDCKK